jgi:hypothetical protein
VEDIKAPVLLIFADADAISTAHIFEFYGLLGGGKRDAGLEGAGRPGAQLAIVTSATHYTILSSPTVSHIVDRFLGEMGKVMMSGTRHPIHEVHVSVLFQAQAALPKNCGRYASPAARYLPGACEKPVGHRSSDSGSWPGAPGHGLL